MTREEEIKARLRKDTAVYLDDLTGGWDNRADDMEYLLARNEELQRRVERLEMALTGIKEEAAKFASDESVIGYTCIGIYTCAESALNVTATTDENATSGGRG